MSNRCVSSCRCCMLASVVHSVAILSAVFCVICSVLMSVSDASGGNVGPKWNSLQGVGLLQTSAQIVSIYLCPRNGCPIPYISLSPYLRYLFVFLLHSGLWSVPRKTSSFYYPLLILCSFRLCHLQLLYMKRVCKVNVGLFCIEKFVLVIDINNYFLTDKQLHVY